MVGVVREMSYETFLKDKRVIFVGACPNIKGMGKGKEIDSYDIVVRTNGSINLIEGDDFVKDYGKKCDVLYVNNQFYRNMSPLPVTDYMRKGVKWMCFKGLNPKDRLRFQKRMQGVRSIKREILEVVKTVPTATMGSFLMLDILRREPKEFFFTGMDFFASRKPEFEHDVYKEYVDGYLPDKIREQGNEINVGKTEDAHDFHGNAKFMYDLFREYDCFKTEDFIFELLEKIMSGEIKQGDVSYG